MFPRATSASAALILLVILLTSGCAVTGSWQLKKNADGVQVLLQEYPGSAIPEFYGLVRIRSSLPQTMMVLTDYALLPEWAWGVREARVLDLVSYTEAYIYQVIDMPLIRDRDLIIHGQTQKDSAGDSMLIHLDAAPEYCLNTASDLCRSVNRSHKVRVDRFHGILRVQQLDTDWVEVTWQQHLEPGGLVPAWATRMMVSSIPVKSLSRLKKLVESRQR